MTMTMRRLSSLVALSLGLAPSLASAKPTRPEPLPAQSDCESFRGTAVGANDPTQLFELRVCPGPTGVSATFQSSSLVSGYSVRASEGSWDETGQRLRLVETRFIENRPEPTWIFCLIDELLLTRTPTGLVGTYVSAACDDRAQLTLERVVTESPGGAAESPPQQPPPQPKEPPTQQTRERPPEEPPKPKPPATPETPSRSGCGCSSGTSEGTGGLAALLLLALVGVRRRRR